MSVEMADIKSLLVKHRRTYHIQDDLHEKVKAYAYWERMSISDVVNTALKGFLDGWDCKEVPKGRNRTEATIYYMKR